MFGVFLVCKIIFDKLVDNWNFLGVGVLRQEMCLNYKREV